MKNITLITLLISMLFLGGCANYKNSMTKLNMETPQADNFTESPENYLLGAGDKIRLTIREAFPPLEQAKIPSSIYHVEVGDILEINFLNNWQFNVTRTVRPDGYITVPLCGDIEARGKTAEELATIIAAYYKQIMSKPYVTVNLYFVNSKRFKDIEGEYIVSTDGKILLPTIGLVDVSGKSLTELAKSIKEKLSKIFYDKLNVSANLTFCANNKFYIGGEIVHPNIYEIDPKLNVLQAIFKAGGVKKTGDLKNIVVIRRKLDNTPEIRVINLSDMMNFAQNITVYPYDIIFIPKTKIASIQSFLDSYLFDLLHLSSTMGFYYSYSHTDDYHVINK